MTPLPRGRRRKIVVVGAGGHAREVLEILRRCRAAGQSIQVLGVLDDAEHLTDLPGGGTRILGGIDWLENAPPGIEAVVAVGTPEIARSLVARVAAHCSSFATVVAPTAWVAHSASLGAGAMLFPNTVVSTDVRVGAHATLNVAATVSHDTHIGSFASIGPGAHVAGNAFVGEACFVGMGANILQGVKVGHGSVVGAGAVVLDDIPDGVTVVGVPARIVGPASLNPMARHSPRRRRSEHRR